MPNPRCNCRKNDATQQRGGPRYALELSGGLRTFLVTWPALSCNLIERNGGRSNWWLGIEAPYDGRTQAKVGAAALDVVKGWDHVHVFPEDKYATCAYYDIHDRDRCDADFFPLSQDICSKRLAKSSTARRSGSVVKGELCVGGMVQRNNTNSKCDSHCQRKYKGFAHQWESVGRCHAALKKSEAYQSVEFILRTRPDVLLLQELDLTGVIREMALARSGAFLPCETVHGGYIDDFVVANKSAMDAYAAKEPMKTEDGHASFQKVAETRVGKVLRPYNPITRIIGHGILDLPMIGKYVRAGTYLPVTYHHGRCVGKEAQRGACPGMEHPAFAQEHYQVLKDYVRAHAPTRADVRGRDVTASDVLLRLNAV